MKNGQVPERVFIGDTSGKTGDFTKNPFCFQPLGLSDIELSIDGLAQGLCCKTNFMTGGMAMPTGDL